MRWIVRGVDRGNGADRVLRLSARSRERAETNAIRRGVLVESVEVAGSGVSAWPVGFVALACLFAAFALDAHQRRAVADRDQAELRRQVAELRADIGALRASGSGQGATVADSLASLRSELIAVDRSIKAIADVVDSNRRAESISINSAIDSANDAHRRIDAILTALRRY